MQLTTIHKKLWNLTESLKRRWWDILGTLNVVKTWILPRLYYELYYGLKQFQSKIQWNYFGKTDSKLYVENWRAQMRILKHFYKNYEWGLIPEVNIYCKASVKYHLWFLVVCNRKQLRLTLKKGTSVAEYGSFYSQNQEECWRIRLWKHVNPRSSPEVLGTEMMKLGWIVINNFHSFCNFIQDSNPRKRTFDWKK